MTTAEKIGTWIGILAAVFTAGAAWNALNNRLERVDEKIGAIQKTIGSTTCNAILSRQMEAIDKNKASVRKALDELSNRYRCGPQEVVVPDFDTANAMNATAPANATYNAQLDQQLDELDAQLNTGN